MMISKKQIFMTGIFLAIESILFYYVLTASGDTLIGTSYLSIVLCFLFARVNGAKTEPYIVEGLLFTMMADFCLVICNPIQRLWGMVFFLAAQSCYAVKLHQTEKTTWIMLLRVALIVAIEVVAAIVLKDKLDLLAVISVCYYANLFVNIVAAFTQWKRNKRLPIGLVLFILCDTVIGLQVAADAYLPIAEGSWLHSLLFSGFNLSWMFYLPSQVLIALSSLHREK